jgi:hypothetical protein
MGQLFGDCKQDGLTPKTIEKVCALLAPVIFEARLHDCLICLKQIQIAIERVKTCGFVQKQANPKSPQVSHHFPLQNCLYGVSPHVETKLFETIDELQSWIPPMAVSSVTSCASGSSPRHSESSSHAVAMATHVNTKVGDFSLQGLYNLTCC